jgi:hypothetical protein
MSFTHNSPIGFVPPPSPLRERLRSLFSKAKQLREDEAEKEKVLKAAYLLRLIDEPVPENTRKWVDYRDEKKAEGRDPDPVEFMKETYAEWYDAGVLSPSKVREYDHPLYTALIYKGYSEHDSSLIESNIFPIDKKGTLQKQAELLAVITGTTSEAIKRLGYTLYQNTRGKVISR